MTSTPNPPPELREFLEHFPGSIHFAYSYNGRFIDLDGSLEENYPALAKASASSHGVYFVPNLLDGNGRRKENVVSCRAVFMDDDKEREKPKPGYLFALPPSLIVETSKGRYHYYWLTSTEDFDRWREVQTTLIELYEGDPAIKDPSRLMRLPTFIRRDKGDFESKVVGGNQEKYNWEEITNAWPPVPKSATQSPTPAKPGDFDIIKTILSFHTAEHIFPSMNSLIMHWTHRYREEYIRASLDSLFNSVEPEVYEHHSVRYENARKQINKQIETARRTVGERGVEIENYVWPDPEPLPSVNKLYRELEFPSEMLPESLKVAAQEIADFNLMSVNDVYPIMLVVICMSINRKALIQCGSKDLENFFHMSVFCVAKSGRFKSTVYSHVLKGVIDADKELVEEYNRQRIEEARIIKRLEAELDKATRASKATDSNNQPIPPTLTSILQDIRQGNELQLELQKLQEKRIPGAFVDDVTQERAIQKCFNAGGAINFVAEEGQGIIASWSDKYNKGKSSNDFAIRAMTGSTYRYDRKCEGETAFKPVASSIIFVQPDIYEDQFLGNKNIYSTGLAARILALYWAPPDYENTEKTEQNEEINEQNIAPYWGITKKLALFDDRPIIPEEKYSTDEVFRSHLIYPVTKLVVGHDDKSRARKLFNDLWKRYGKGKDLEGKEEFLNKSLMLAYIMAGSVYAYENNESFFIEKEHKIDGVFYNRVKHFLEYLVQKKANENEIREKAIQIREAKRLLKLFTGKRRNHILDGLSSSAFQSFTNYRRSNNQDAIDGGLDLLIELGYLNYFGYKLYLNPKVE